MQGSRIIANQVERPGSGNEFGLSRKRKDTSMPGQSGRSIE